jgi:hypothetical protein
MTNGPDDYLDPSKVFTRDSFRSLASVSHDLLKWPDKDGSDDHGREGASGAPMSTPGDSRPYVSEGNTPVEHNDPINTGERAEEASHWSSEGTTPGGLRAGDTVRVRSDTGLPKGEHGRTVHITHTSGRLVHGTSGKRTLTYAEHHLTRD